MTRAQNKKRIEKWKWPTMAVIGLGIVIYEVIQYRRADQAHAALIAQQVGLNVAGVAPGPYVVPMDGVAAGGMLSRAIEAAR